MTKQEKQENQDQKNQDQDQDQEPVVLDPKTYQALLEHLDDLEGQVKEKGSSSNNLDDLDSLADEARGSKQQQQEEEVDFDGMSRKDFLQYTLKQLSEEVVSPLAVAIEEVKLSQEIDQLTRDEKYADFWDHKDEIYKIAKDNPRLSLKKVYKLAKSEAEDKKTSDSETKTKSRKGLLRHLPDSTFGERPSGQAESTTEKSEPATLKEAASRAFDEIMEGNKE